MSRSGFFFYPHPGLSSLIFSICRYWVPIRHVALTDIFLDNTAASRKKYLHSLIVVVCWNKVNIFIWPFLILHNNNTGLPPYLCYQVSLWRGTVTADPRVQPAEVCETQPTLCTSISLIAFFIFIMLWNVKWRTRAACLFHTRSASPQFPVLHALLHETHETSMHTGML